MANNWDLTTMSASIPGKDKLALFYSNITNIDSIPKLFKQIPGVEGVGSFLNNAQDVLELIDLPLPLRLMMFRLKKHDGTDSGIPNLFLRVNPDKFKVTYKKKSDLVYTSGGFVVQHWHDDKIKISASGWVPSFRGRAKILTEGYRMFLDLLDIYLQCGSVQSFLGQQLVSKNIDIKAFLKKYTDVPAEKVTGEDKPTEEVATEPTVYETLVMYPKVELIYQNDIYEGIFTEFNSEESYEQPNTLQYNFEFLADKRTDTVTGALGRGLGVVSGLLRMVNTFSGPRTK